MSIGKRIKKIKSILHVTSKDMAKALDIPVRTIGSYERDEAQPGPKFFKALLEVYRININWMLTGDGSMFCQKQEYNEDIQITQLKERLNLSDKELMGLLSIMESDASRDMVLKFIDIRQGNKKALDTLIYNLQGIKASFSFFNKK